MVRSRSPRRLGALMIAVALVALGLSACLPPPSGTPARITTDPPLFPAFQSGVLDYVVRCDPNTPVAVHMTTPTDTYVSVEGRYPRGGVFGELVNQRVGQRFTIRVTTDATHDVSTTYHVRCLPPDFPQWSVQRNGQPQAEYFATTLLSSPPTGANYSAVFDTNGVPVWWTKNKTSTFMLTPLPGQHLGTDESSGLVEYDLNGQIVQQFGPVGGNDFHEVIRLANGNYVMATQDAQPCDLTSWGLTASESCLNHVIQELQPPATPGGTPTVVWQWDTSQHIPITETTATWRSVFIGSYDPYHLNSIEDTGDGYIVSFRHLDAVYKIDKATGNVVWKLGGTPRAESLQLVGDALNGTSGQHDARLLPDGTVTIHDNGSGPQRQPRVIRYAIDSVNKTATLVQDVRDSAVTTSVCCGSARLLPGGDWVVGWGGGPMITENRPDGTEVFRLTGAGTFVYRAIPILPGQFARDQFRAGMDAQYQSG
jgi:Arylsulfotransferase (ASST)